MHITAKESHLQETLWQLSSKVLLLLELILIKTRKSWPSRLSVIHNNLSVAWGSHLIYFKFPVQVKNPF